MADFTLTAQKALALARREAARLNHPSVCTEDLLLGLIALEPGVMTNILKKMGIELSAIRQETEKQVHPGPAPDHPLRPGKIPFTPRFKSILVLAGKEAKAMNHRSIGTEHLLLGLIRGSDGVAARILTALGIDLERTRAEIVKELDPTEVEKKSLFVPVGEVDLIRQELAVLKSRVETIGLTVDAASQRSRPSTSSEVTSSLRRLSGPRTTANWNAVPRFLNYAVWFTAFVLLLKMLVRRFRKS